MRLVEYGVLGFAGLWDVDVMVRVCCADFLGILLLRVLRYVVLGVGCCCVVFLDWLRYLDAGGSLGLGWCFWLLCLLLCYCSVALCG